MIQTRTPKSSLKVTNEIIIKHHFHFFKKRKWLIAALQYIKIWSHKENNQLSVQTNTLKTFKFNNLTSNYSLVTGK